MKINDTSFVSVIVTNYNYCKYLRECIESVSQQTYENLEIILVDDGSTDESRDVVKSISDPRFKVIYQDNRGQASAFNKGVEAANGDYIAFLDADDLWYPTKLEKTLNTFRKSPYIAIQHRLEIIDAESKVIGGAHPGVTIGSFNILKAYFREGHTNHFCATSGLVCESNVLQTIFPLDESWKICADVLLTRPLPLFGKIYTLPEILGGYRVHDNNGWMNSEMQSDVLANSKASVDHTNLWLDRMESKRKIVFKKSTIVRRLRRKEYGRFNPRRFYLHLMILYQTLPRKLIALKRRF